MIVRLQLLKDRGRAHPTATGITDFHHATARRRRIDLSTIDANTHKHGNQAFHFIGSHHFGHNAGELRYSSHIVQGDVNGDGKADFDIHVNASHLVQGDFLL